nr:hypothetical protein [uncultured Aminipila sp.]
MKKIDYYILKKKHCFIFTELVKGWLFRDEYGIHRNGKYRIIITDLATGIGVADGQNTVEAYNMFNNYLDLIAREKNRNEYKLNKELISASLKQQPKEPIKIVIGDKTKIGNLHFGKGCTVHKCPECESFIGCLNNYCSDCGQHIDWDEIRK